MSTTLKNPEEQDDRKKGTLSNQPRLTRITPTALLGSWEWQPIKDMTSLRNDFEMHTYWQGCTEEHLRPVNVIMHLFGDGDLDVGHCKVKTSAAKEFIARKTRTSASGGAWGTYWNRIKCKERFGNPPGAVIRQATINPEARIWKSFEDSLPKMYCTDLKLMSCKKVWAQGFVKKKCMIRGCPTDIRTRYQGPKTTSRSERNIASCVRNMGAHVLRTTSDCPRNEKMGKRIWFPYSQESHKEISKELLRKKSTIRK